METWGHVGARGFGSGSDAGALDGANGVVSLHFTPFVTTYHSSLFVSLLNLTLDSCFVYTSLDGSARRLRKDVVDAQVAQ